MLKLSDTVLVLTLLTQIEELWQNEKKNEYPVQKLWHQEVCVDFGGDRFGHVFIRLRNSSDSVVKSPTLLFKILSGYIWSTQLCVRTHSVVFIFLNSILNMGLRSLEATITEFTRQQRFGLNSASEWHLCEVWRWDMQRIHHPPGAADICRWQMWNCASGFPGSPCDAEGNMDRCFVGMLLFSFGFSCNNQVRLHFPVLQLPHLKYVA